MAFLYGDEASKAFVSQETTPGQPPALASADMITVVKSSITINQERIDTEDNRGYRSPAEMIIVRESGEFTLDCLLRVSGTAGTAPPLSELFKSHFGTQTDVATTSNTFTFKSRPVAGDLLSYYEKMHGGKAQKFFTGGYPKTMSIDASDLNAPIKVSFGGSAMYGGMIYNDRANGAIDVSTLTAGTAAAKKLTVDDAKNFMPRGLIQATSSGAAQIVDRINVASSAEDVYMIADLPADIADNDVVQPYFPAEATSIGDVLLAKDMFMSFDGGTTEIAVTGFSISSDNMNEMYYDSTSDRYAGVVGTDKFSVTCDITLMANSDHIPLISDFLRGTSQDLFIRVGPNTAGDRMKFNLNAVQFPPMLPELDPRGVGTLTLTGEAYKSGSSTSEDLLEIVCD